MDSSVCLSVCLHSYRMSHVQEDHDEAFLPFVGIIIAELTSATVVYAQRSRLPPAPLPFCTGSPPVRRPERPVTLHLPEVREMAYRQAHGKESGHAMNILTDAITQFFVNLINGFLQGISGPFNSLVPLLGNTPLPLTTTNAVVSGTWTVMTGVADAFLGLIVVIAAMQMLYGQTTGTLYIPPGQFVPKLVLTVVLVNLSQLIGQDLILLNNALCGLVRVDVANFIQQTGGATTGRVVGLSTVLAILATVSLIRIIFQAFKRIVLFDILFVLSGPAFLLSFHPLTAPWFSFWARLFVVTVFSQFFQFLGIGLGIQLIIDSRQTGAIGIFLATAMFTLVAEIPHLLSRFSGAQVSPSGGLVRSALTAAVLFSRA